MYSFNFVLKVPYRVVGGNKYFVFIENSGDTGGGGKDTDKKTDPTDQKRDEQLWDE